MIKAAEAQALRKVSIVPDLIHDRWKWRRTREIETHLLERGDEMPAVLHRLVLFVTFRCNLRCRYCKTTGPARAGAGPGKRRDYDLGLFRRMLDSLRPLSVRHIHFTGGEATLSKDLPHMVALAEEKGILTSLTTNGTAPVETYRDLVEKGLREVRVSLDSPFHREFDEAVGRSGTFRRVTKTLEALVRLRDEEMKDLFIIINACVGRRNRHILPTLVERFADLRPNDIKLITQVQDAESLGDFETRQAMTARVEELLAPLGEEAFPLLRYKLKTLFDKEAIGLRDADRDELRHCFIPLTERTVDSTGYYPCSVYLREGGAPTGDILGESLQVQHRKILDFIRSSACLDDPICKKYCLHCCKAFNRYANRRIERPFRVGPAEDGRAVQLDQVDCPTVIPRRAVLARMQEIESERRRFHRLVPYRPFLVIKPSGMKVKEKLLREIRSFGIAVEQRIDLENWNEIALRLYSYPLTEWKVLRGMVLDGALPAVEGTSKGELLWLDDDLDVGELEAVKLRIRSHFPILKCHVRWEGKIIKTALSYLHSPTERSYFIEYNVLMEQGRTLRWPLSA